MVNELNPNGNEPNVNDNDEFETIKIGEYEVEAKLDKDGVPTDIVMPDLEGAELEAFEKQATNTVNAMKSATNKYQAASSEMKKAEKLLAEIEERERKAQVREQLLEEKIRNLTLNNQEQKKQTTPTGATSRISLSEFVAQNSEKYGTGDPVALQEENPAMYNTAINDFVNERDRRTEQSFSSLLDQRLSNLEKNNQQQIAQSGLYSQIQNDPDISESPADVKKWCADEGLPFNATAIRAYKALNGKQPNQADMIDRVEKTRKSVVRFVKPGDVRSNRSQSLNNIDFDGMSPEQIEKHINKQKF